MVKNEALSREKFVRQSDEKNQVGGIACMNDVEAMPTRDLQRRATLTHAAPVPALSDGPPKSAVSPSDEIAAL